MLRQTTRHLTVIALGFLAFLTSERHAEAQAAPERSGFTILAGLGVGFQLDSGIEESAFGVGGPNLGVGGFLTDSLALMLRLSGTNVFHDFGKPGEVDGAAGVYAAAVQYWLTDRFDIEAGAGVGTWTSGEDGDTGSGLILGAGVTIFNRGKHNLQIGFEYAPVFTNPRVVHNVGFTLGYQFL